MSETSRLSRRVAEAVVEALKGHGHVLLVKGGTEPLVRQVDALVEARLSGVGGGLVQREVVGEVTSTFGDEAIDEAVEELVDGIASSLMESDHVEDVFAEDHVMRRDIFRAVRDTMLTLPPDDLDDEVPSPISVRLDTLGYVASTVARRADAETLRDALERAAAAAEGELSAYDATARQATFTTTASDPDARLELEEAVAEELEELAHTGLVDLPSVERTVELPRALVAAGRKALEAAIDGASARTLLSAGYMVDWELAEGDRVRLTLTPRSEPDGHKVDERMTAFARELAGVAADGAAPTDERRHAAVAEPEPVEAVSPTRRSKTRPSEPAPVEEPKPRSSGAPSSKRAPASKRPSTRAAKAPPSSRRAPAATPAPTRAKPAKRTAAAKKTAAGSTSRPAVKRKKS